MPRGRFRVEIIDECALASCAQAMDPVEMDGALSQLAEGPFGREDSPLQSLAALGKKLESDNNS